MKFSSTIMITLIFPAVAFGDVYIYPNKGQSQQQQSKDRYECHTWDDARGKGWTVTDMKKDWKRVFPFEK